jgi:2',3'-cyclic-nucleotide 2'-phosphodiesterase/3'-nucleotidase/5'-nucleotidase
MVLHKHSIGTTRYLRVAVIMILPFSHGCDRDLTNSTQFRDNPAFTGIELVPIGQWTTDTFDEGGAEISAFDPASARLFVVNSADVTIEILDLSDPTQPTKVPGGSVDITQWGGRANSVAIHDGLVAVAVEAEIKQEPGAVVFLDTDGDYLGMVEAGALPDMVTFTPNGRHVLVANEGEPNSDYTVDPDGSITIIDVTKGPAAAVATQVLFDADIGPLDASVRVFGPAADAAADFEPEYITTSHDSRTAWVTLQENNAIAIVDVREAIVTDVIGLGFKDHSMAGNALDPSDRDGGVHIANWPVFGVYMPDAIASFRSGADTFLLTANEGDAREYDSFSEESRIRDVTLDPIAFPSWAALQDDAMLGRLQITTTLGDIDDDGDYDELYAFGARSFSVRKAVGDLLWDSGDQLEQLTSVHDPANFNADNSQSGMDQRSDAKGPEVEGICVGKVAGHPYAFVGLERSGGIVVYDLTVPTAPTFATYVTSRDPVEPGVVADLGPEGIVFISEDDSPTGAPLLVVSYEVSGTVAVYEIHKS